ncbi:MAG TPA: hypothetical protein PK152_00840 [Anaerolineales bacterium]|jgi:hypothetical protein|nr:hypothetical protein [Anaerolineae bacterium]HRJ56616.1 hypothetical protein [Anaerolineales bacterium]HRK87646.1 hypothetical protein [Anaerolineales bacterium]
MNTSNIFELRVAVTAQNYESLVKFYCIGLGIEPAAIWNNDGGKALMLNMGNAVAKPQPGIGRL